MDRSEMILTEKFVRLKKKKKKKKKKKRKRKEKITMSKSKQLMNVAVICFPCALLDSD